MAVRRPLVLNGNGRLGELLAADVLAGQIVSTSMSFGGGRVVTASTEVFFLPYAGTISALYYRVGTAGGSFTATVLINGVAVTGLNAVSVTTNTLTAANATGASAFAANSEISITTASVVGSPTGGLLAPVWSRT